jgi:hypothetical protein
MTLKSNLALNAAILRNQTKYGGLARPKSVYGESYLRRIDVRQETNEANTNGQLVRYKSHTML